MKKLPLYFVIEQDKKNPLWEKYIAWLNKKYDSSWEGDWYTYYGRHNITGHDVTNAYDSIDSFDNNPTIITLEEWDECVNGFILPKKWYVLS